MISLAQWRKTKTYPGLHPVIDSSITYLKKALERDPILQSAPLLRVVLDGGNKTLTIDNEFWMWECYKGLLQELHLSVNSLHFYIPLK